MGHSLELSDEAAALAHLISPWARKLSVEQLEHLQSAHAESTRMLDATMWVVNNTYVSLSDIDCEAFEEAVNWVIYEHPVQGMPWPQRKLRSGMSKGDKS